MYVNGKLLYKIKKTAYTSANDTLSSSYNFPINMVILLWGFNAEKETQNNTTKNIQNCLILLFFKRFFFKISK